MMSGGNPKRTVLAAFAEVAMAFADGHQLESLEQLAQGEQSVEALAERVARSIANTSQHLRFMRAAGALSSRRDGKRILYALSDPAVLNALAALQKVAERNADRSKNTVSAPRVYPHRLLA